MTYTGQTIDLPLGYDGMTGTKNLLSAPPGALVGAVDVTYEDGTLRKEGGSVKYNSSAIGALDVLGGWDWLTNAFAQRMIVGLSDKTIRKDSGTGTFPVTLKTLTNTPIHYTFVEGGKEVAANNRKLFIFTGNNAVQVLADDGATTADIALPPADWSGTNQPTFGFVHGFRLLAGGNFNSPHRIYYSTTTSHEDFTGAGSGSIAVYPGEGKAIIGGISFNNYAVVFKNPYGIYLIDMRDPDTTKWTTRRITRAVGAAGPNCIVQTDHDVVFLDTVGSIQSLLAVQSSVDVISTNISQTMAMDTFIRDNTNLAWLPLAQGVFYAAKRELHFALPLTGQNFPSYRFILDSNRPDKIRFRFSIKDVCRSIWLRKDSQGVPRIAAGDNAGFVWLLDQTLRAKDGAGYLAYIQTVPTDLSFADPALATVFKNAEFLELIYASTGGGGQITVQLEWDGVVRQVLYFTPPVTGALLGSFILGTDKLGLGPLQMVRTRKRLYGGGKRLSLIITNNASGQDFSILHAILSFTLGNN